MINRRYLGATRTLRIFMRTECMCWDWSRTWHHVIWERLLISCESSLKLLRGCNAKPRETTRDGFRVFTFIIKPVWFQELDVWSNNVINSLSKRPSTAPHILHFLASRQKYTSWSKGTQSVQPTLRDGRYFDKSKECSANIRKLTLFERNGPIW
jgi:hypothetical protein